MSKFGYMVFGIVIIVTSLITLALSFSQLKAIDGINKCKCMTLVAPLRLIYKGEFFCECGWYPDRSAFRLVYLIVFLIILAPMYYISIVYQKLYLLISCSILILINSGVGAYSFVADGIAVVKSTYYCGGVYIIDEGVRVSHGCQLIHFYTTVAFGALNTILMIIFSILSFELRHKILFKNDIVSPKPAAKITDTTTTATATSTTKTTTSKTSNIITEN